MAIIHCLECGKEISDTAYVCPHCGHQRTDIPYSYKRIIPGRGFGISSMVIGIIGVLYGIIAFTNIKYITTDAIAVSAPAFWSIILATLALVFGFSSRRRGYEKGTQKVGVILGAITLVLALCSILISLYII